MPVKLDMLLLRRTPEGRREFWVTNVTGRLGGGFRVTGGPLTGEQQMGWHVTDASGMTVAVSCDADFIDRVTVLHQLADTLASQDPMWSVATGSGTKLVCVHCGREEKRHTDECAWLRARKLTGRPIP